VLELYAVFSSGRETVFEVLLEISESPIDGPYKHLPSVFMAVLGFFLLVGIHCHSFNFVVVVKALF